MRCLADVRDSMEQRSSAPSCVPHAFLCRMPQVRTAMVKDGKNIELEAGQDVILVAVGDQVRGHDLTWPVVTLLRHPWKAR